MEKLMTVLPNGATVKIQSELTMTESQINRLNCSVNEQTIANWLKDMHLTHRTYGINSIITEEYEFATAVEMKSVRRKHHEFLDYLDTLPEVDSPAEEEDMEANEKLNKNIEFVKETISELEKKNIRGAALMTNLTDHLLVPCGKIAPNFLKECLEAWLKHVAYGK